MKILTSGTGTTASGALSSSLGIWNPWFCQSLKSLNKAKEASWAHGVSSSIMVGLFYRKNRSYKEQVRKLGVIVTKFQKTNGHRTLKLRSKALNISISLLQIQWVVRFLEGRKIFFRPVFGVTSKKNFRNACC